MSQKLSRVERLGRRNPGKPEPQSKANLQEQVPDEIMLNTAVYQAAAAREFPEPVIPPRKSSRTQTETGSAASPRQKKSFSMNVDSPAASAKAGGNRASESPKRIRNLEPEKGQQKETEVYPSRTELFPSHRIKWTRWFFNVLLIIFIGVTVWLLWWGFHASPWSLKRGE